jgi:hypothetical protein
MHHTHIIGVVSRLSIANARAQPDGRGGGFSGEEVGPQIQPRIRMASTTRSTATT